MRSEVHAEKRASPKFFFGNETFLAHFLLDGILEIVWGTEAGLGS